MKSATQNVADLWGPDVWEAGAWDGTLSFEGGLPVPEQSPPAESIHVCQWFDRWRDDLSSPDAPRTKKTHRCPDCAAAIYHTATRCRPCAMKAFRARERAAREAAS